MKKITRWRPKEIKEAMEYLIKLGFDLDKNSARDFLIAINEILLIKYYG